ncbi:MAG: sterol desaturase family protein [Weeksellaceae bacterium]|nr:sterol desaturase family protein [Weeksellaceae bacterium]
MLHETNYALLVLMISLRYFFLAGITYFVFYRILRLKIVRLKIQQKFPMQKDYIREIKHSFLTILIFAGYAFLIFSDDFRSKTQIYDNFQEHSILYFFASIILAILIHDTYFYFMHRIMHHRLFFKHIHLIHHKSTNPNPFSSYSFHPSEAIIEGAVILVIVFTIPIHKIAIGLFLLFMILFNIYGHLGYELIPKKISNSALGKWINTATYHNVHHKNSKKNFGLYFTFWDRIFNTLEQKTPKE